MSGLTDTCGVLQRHFEALRDARLNCQPTQPVFALEHPLDLAEVHTTAKELSECLHREGHVNLRHALAWVVVASEVGYDFGGCEFWQSFDERIPNWSELGDRNALRGAFQHFCGQYQGVQPVGQWAARYTLICWPISHAILPRDLQRHLCEAVYVARYQLAGSRGTSMEQIGAIVADTAPSRGTRFEEFLQEHALIGAIVNRLLLGDTGTDTSFRPETFARISRDLHQMSATREWLRDAGRLYNRNVLISVPRDPGTGSTRGGFTDQHEFDLRPTLILQRDESGIWAPCLIPPSLLAWARTNSDVARDMEVLRYRVVGTDRARQGACLLAAVPPQAVLSTFPPLDQPLIELLPHHDRLSALFNTDCRLRASHALVFREHSGTATLSRKLEVNPGDSYLLATQDFSLKFGVSVPCVDPTWQLRRLQLPATLTAPLLDQIAEAGIHVRRSTRLRPWGLMPRNWDEENNGEWIVTEPIVYVIERDHLFEAISICIDGDRVEFLECDGMADPTVVIKDLPVGAHTLTVQTFEGRKSRSGSSWHELSRGEARIRVRTPCAWTPGDIGVNALTIETSPLRPTLEDLLKGDLILTVEGTDIAPVDISLHWTDGSPTTASSINILRQRAPVSHEAWTGHLSAFRRKAEKARVGLGTQQAALRVACEPLGEQKVLLGVHASPVRWSLRNQNVYLICDGAHVPQVGTSSFAEPAVLVGFDRRTCERGLKLTQSGLYLAVDGKSGSGIVLGDINGTAAAFQQLGEQIRVDTIRSCDMHDLLIAMQRWEAAIPLTVYASTNQQRVVAQLHTEALRRVTGDEWIKLEASHPRDWAALEEAVDRPLRVHSFGYRLGRYRRQVNSKEALKHQFFEAAIAYAITHDAAYLNMAWNLATRRVESPAFAPPAADKHLLARLVKGARLLWLGNQPAVLHDRD